MFWVSVKLQTNTEAATRLSEVHARCWLGEQPPSGALRGNRVSQGPQLGQLQIWTSDHWPTEVKNCWNLTLHEDRLVELKNSATILFLFYSCRQPQCHNPKMPLLQTLPVRRMNIQDRRKKKPPNTMSKKGTRETRGRQEHGFNSLVWPLLQVLRCQSTLPRKLVFAVLFYISESWAEGEKLIAWACSAS